MPPFPNKNDKALSHFFIIVCSKKQSKKLPQDLLNNEKDLLLKLAAGDESAFSTVYRNIMLHYCLMRKRYR